MIAPSPQIEWHTASDGRRLVSRVWTPSSKPTSGEPAARVVFLHGIVSHGGWYAASSAHLAGAGCEVHFLERRGSGLNADCRGDIDHWETWPSDVESYLRQLGTDRPRVLCGISWGGKLATAVARRRPELVDGLALLCPGIFAFQQPGFLKRTLLKLPRGPLLSRTVPVPLQDPSLFTEDARHQSYIHRDPLALRHITLRFAQADQQLTQFAREATADSQSNWPPSLLVLAGKDRIVDPVATKNFFAKLNTPDKTILEYPIAAHTLEFDPDPIPCFRELATWIGHVSGTKR